MPAELIRAIDKLEKCIDPLAYILRTHTGIDFYQAGRVVTPEFLVTSQEHDCLTAAFTTSIE